MTIKPIFLKISTFVLLFILIGTGCKKEFIVPSNIILYDKPLSVIQSCIKGKWRLHYSYGGFASHKYVDTYNSYMILSPDHVTKGNDFKGIYLDTTITWVRIDSTYRLNYSWPDRPIPVYEIVSQIKNDTLIIIDDLDDGYKHYYTKY